MQLKQTVLIYIVLGGIVQPASAVLSGKTPRLVGHMPVMATVSLPVGAVMNGATMPVSDHAKVGGELTTAMLGINELVTDKDGDQKAESLYEWLIDGAVVSIGSSYTPSVGDGGQFLSMRITPKTVTGDPAAGRPLTSNQIYVRSAIIDRFTKPSASRLLWRDANSYCSSLAGGYRLPLIQDLKQLYLEMTRQKEAGSSSADACSYYGWPLNGICKGETSRYWSSQPAAENIYNVVDLNLGISGNVNDVTYMALTTCIKK